MPSGGVVGLLPSREVVLTSWEAWVGLCLGGHLLPCLRVLLLLLARPAWVPGGLGGLLPSDEGRRALAWEGEKVVPWERLLSSPGGVAPAWRALAWEREEAEARGRLLSSPGEVEPAWGALTWEREEVVAWERLPSSLGGVAPAWEREEVVAWGRLLSSPGGVAPVACLGRSTSFPSLTSLACEEGGVLASPEGPGKTCCLPQREERPGG